MDLDVISRKIPCVMTIAGSDSGGGAGIQADLKTFSALGVFGTCVITAVTAQNTRGVESIFPLPPAMVRSQIRAIIEDIPVRVAKTGMLYSREIMEEVSKAIDEYRITLVADPVIRAGSGGSLMIEEDKNSMIKLIVPRSIILTPNVFEAEIISGIKIRSLDDMKNAAKRIVDLGAESVIIKGGHMKEEDSKVCDLFYHEESFRIFEKKRLMINPHGGGCTFSAAIASFLACGETLENAVEESERFVEISFRGALKIGSGRTPVNPMASLYNKAGIAEAIKQVDEVARIIERNPSISRFYAEVGIQIAMAPPYPRGPEEVAAIDGRIVKTLDGLKTAGPPRLGASRHMASIILTAMKYDPQVRAAMNLHYSPILLEAFRKIGCKVSGFDRNLEPNEIKSVEGKSLPWGVEEAIRKMHGVPDVIYDEGEIGKEPMIRVLGRNALDTIDKVLTAIKNI
ncbi:bifunctional hydroxymethylpyrimidine kinase/phosphomethylpyrimidine kinase [Candidatus Bathyarchaeota archaeon]|nr:MAG: bifunctional hydroxymethylpyrimidine kinase/phosphomethylpyrimidine kinase [Candidatus Bathyarchaeota archaeon]